MEKSETDWVPFLVITGIVFLFVAGFYTGVPTWLDHLDYVFIVGGVVALILAAIELRKRNKE